MRRESSSGKLRARRRAICSGLHARTHRCGCRRPLPAPLPRHHRPADHRAAWRDDHAGQPLLHVPPQLSIDRELRRLRPARGAIRTPLRRRPSVLEAAGARGGVAAQLPRASRRAISRTPCPWARQCAICSRSVNARYRPDGGGADGMRCDAAMPPASRNHRVPTAGHTPAPTAASSLERRAALAAQNQRRSSCRPTEGRPGERSLARPAPSERRLCVVIATPSGAVLRRPVESTQYLSIRYTERLAQAGIEPSVGSTGDPSSRTVEGARGGRVRDTRVGRVVQRQPPVRTARLRSAGRVREGLP
jgi:hypothetical protein